MKYIIINKEFKCIISTEDVTEFMNELQNQMNSYKCIHNVTDTGSEHIYFIDQENQDARINQKSNSKVS